MSKRKVRSSALPPRKRTKTMRVTAEDLPWKVVAHQQEAGINNALEGMMELEEVDGVDVVFEETEAGKVVRFAVAPKEENVPGDDEDEPDIVAGPSHIPNIQEESIEEVEQVFDSKTLLPDWHPFELHPQLLSSLYAQHFTTPTPIQSKAIPAAAKGKDIVGVAETGSGKTLAYGLPMLHYLLKEAARRRKSGERKKRPLRGLILAPTRELALQVASHLKACLNYVDPSAVAVKTEEEGTADVLNAEVGKKNKKNKQKSSGSAKNTAPAANPKPTGPPPVSVAAIVGGMSAQKQRRIIERGVDVLVATPGRLWDLLQEDDKLASGIKNLKFLVLDEADRMIETGHFAELDNILRLTLRQDEEEAIEPESTFADAEGPIPQEKSDAKTVDGMQTFVFSATLSKDLQRNLKKRFRPNNKKKGPPASTLDDLLLRLDLRDPDPEVIDLSPEGGVVSSLKQSQIACLPGDKDAYLYYFLLRYPGRSLVFLSSIDGIRRLLPLMELLELKAFPLHSQLEQRQRLKNLDRFKSTPNSILLATDIAARGLDIPAVDHVIHYQIPRSADVYVHRNGRTARAMRTGFSLLMCAPDERRLVRAVLGSVGREESDIPEMAVDLYLMDKLKARIQLARQIDNAQHKIRKENHDKHWLKEVADAMEIELDSDLAPSSDDDTPGAGAGASRAQRKSRSARTAILKGELKQLLAQPLVARGISTRYITSGGTALVDDVMAGNYHETMVGLTKSTAGTDVAPAKKKKVKQQPPEEEEWTGFSS